MSEPVITIDPGHGGDDLGAVVKGRQEKAIVLAVAKILAKKLSPWKTRLTREGDYYVPLDRRIEHSLADGASLFISLHANQVANKKSRGIAIYAYGKSRWFIPRRLFRRKLPQLPAPPAKNAREGAGLAKAVANGLRAQGLDSDPDARAAYYVLKNPEIPSILIELGYLSNPQEAALLADPDYQERLAEGIAEGLRGYLASARSSSPDFIAGKK
jgi:N-acetylmuramoyl-L-alanine amidase